MIIQHNLTAFNSNRQLGITTGLQARSSEKLSSGYKINRAADDAAGLSISEKMRRQIRGLSQASENVQDGISYVQVADAALAEIDEMLNRMNELCIKAATETLTDEDRAAIDAEIQQLKVESNRTFGTTSFNEKLIWDEHTTDRKQIGTEKRPIFTWGNNGYGYSNTITDTNRGAWPKNGRFNFSADSDGVTVSWTGFDGVNYSSKKNAWPSEEELKSSGFSFSLNSSNMDYNQYPNAVGINPNLSVKLDEDATMSQFISAINNSGVSFYKDYSLSGSVAGDSNSYISGVLHYNAALVSGTLENPATDHIDGSSSNRDSSDSSDTTKMGYSFTFTKDSNTTPATPSTFGVTASSTGYVATYSSDKRPETKGIWWNTDSNGHTYQHGHGASNASDLAAVIKSQLDGTADHNYHDSLTNFSANGGTISIRLNLTADSAVNYTNGSTTGDAVTSIGYFDINMNVGADETTEQVIQRIANITGVELNSPNSAGSMYLYNSNASTYDAPVYGGTMALNIQAGSEGNNDNIIPIIYDVLNNHSLGINDLNTLTSTNAQKGIVQTKEAKRIVDEQRAVFGSYQNRMEHTYNNLGNVVENTQQAESIIRDTDMAKEMVKYSNNNILAQAGQSMLAQANQTNQGVLSLLQ